MPEKYLHTPPRGCVQHSVNRLLQKSEKRIAYWMPVVNTCLEIIMGRSSVKELSPSQSEYHCFVLLPAMNCTGRTMRLGVNSPCIILLSVRTAYFPIISIG